MSDGAWSFRTTNGVVTVHSDEIVIRASPWQLLTSQSHRWQHGRGWERVKVPFVVVGFLLSVVGLLYHLYLITSTEAGVSTAFYASSVGFFGYSLWQQFGRNPTIPRAAIRSVILDADARRLRITYDAAGRPLQLFRDQPAEHSVTLGSDDAVRRARESFRLRGIEIEEGSTDQPVEYEHRYVTKGDGCYCEACGSLVTPNDKVCRSCEYELWVEIAVAT